MKKVLLDSEKNYYKANLHCHTTESDGAFTPKMVKELYKANGYSVVAFTDHEHLIDNSHLNDEEFVVLTACEIAIKQFPNLSTLKKTDMKVCHLNLISKNPHNVDTPCYNSVYDHFCNAENKNKIIHTCGEYERVYSGKGISEIIEIANKNGFLVCYNHPRWSLENARDYLGYEGLWAVEIYNTGCMRGGIYEYDINAYDDFLRDGHKIACVAADDNHNEKDMFGGWVMINSEKLDYESVVEALENHNFYASEGPVIKRLEITDTAAVLTYEKGCRATISCQSRRAQVKKAENPNGENTVEFEILPHEDGYVRFEVADEHGNCANTCAYFISDLISE